jgi:hypothetical protein
VLEVTFNTFTPKRVFRLEQNNRADDLLSANPRSQKRFAVRKLRVGEFHTLTVRLHLFPFISQSSKSQASSSHSLVGDVPGSLALLGKRRRRLLFANEPE